MKVENYFILFDITGFPLIRRDDWDYAIGLFPVSKYQFEHFMAEQGPSVGIYTDEWYKDLLHLNPRSTWKRYDERPWEMFLTGISPADIKPFLDYLGQGFRLPKVEEWRKVLEHSEEIQKIRHPILHKITDKRIPLPVSLWIEKGVFPLAKEGLIEMVMDDGDLRYIGRPYNKFLSNTWSAKMVRDINWDVARRLLGFRVVKEGSRNKV